MRKVFTLFQRDPGNPARVTDVVNPACTWVLAGEGVATRKFDGTCMMFDGIAWWARRTIKPGGLMPTGFVELQRDPVTHQRVGWEPIERSPFARALHDALREASFRVPPEAAGGLGWSAGTYELVGPKVGGNPMGFTYHELIEHTHCERLDDRAIDGRRLPGSITANVKELAERGWEGVVWHHPDGRMAKLKARDYGITVRWPS